MAYLEWLGQRVHDSAAFQRLDPADPRRAVVAERLLPSLADPTRRLLVTPQRHQTHVRILKDAFNRHRQWLHEQGAGDLNIADEEVPAWPETDRTRSEEEGRSEDALPETVFLQLLRDDVLALLPPAAGATWSNCTPASGGARGKPATCALPAWTGTPSAWSGPTAPMSSAPTRS
ncbi:MAG TPA: hypothetical protein VGS14_05010 [Actinomycetes bacterium]|jgi:hypothetical protein|nr:hypothetical protein [Actinomycetes bacterium]